MHTDFGILFESNASVVIAQMRQLEAQALRTQSVLNQIGQTNARVAGAGAGPAALGGLTSGNVAAVAPQVDRLTRSLGKLQSEMSALSALGINPTLAQTRREMTLLQQITAAGGPAFGRFNSATSAAAQGLSALNPAAQASAQQLIANRAALDNTSAAFQRHVGRIQETILVYAAFAAAATAATNAVGLAVTLDRESARLEAVTGLNQAQSPQFIDDLFSIAVSTVTPIEDIVAEADRAAAAFPDLSAGAERAAATELLLADAGKLTSVTQRDMGTEVQNAIAIFKQAGIPIENLGDLLGKFVVAGGNASTRISDLVDAFVVAGKSAETAGVPIETFLALASDFIAQTGDSGSTVGNTFKTLFATILNDPRAEKGFQNITNGMVSIFDEAGNLRSVVDVLLDVNALVEQGLVDKNKLDQLFTELVPPLAPGRKSDLVIFFESLAHGINDTVSAIEKADVDALDQLVNKINATLGQQFKQRIEQLKQGFNKLFGADIIGTGQTFINFMKSLGDAINALPPDVVRMIGAFVAFTAAAKGLQFVGGALLSVLGFGGVGGAIKNAAAAAAAAGTNFGIMDRAAAGLSATLGRLLPLMIAFAAIQVATDTFDKIQKRTVLQELGFSESQAIEGSTNLPGAQGTSRRPPTGGIGGVELVTTENQRENLSRLATAVLQLRASGQSTAEGEAAMAASIRDATGAISDQLISITDIVQVGAELALTTDEGTSAFERQREAARQRAIEIANMSEQDRIATEAARLLTATQEGQAKDLEKLAERLRTGKINAEEFAQGQQLVVQAAELAAKLVATAGDRLGEYPIFAAAAKEGEEALTQAVYEQIVASGGSINAIVGLIQQLGNLATANAATAGSLAAHPLIIRMATEKVSSEDLANNPELSAARRFAQNATGLSVTNPFGSATADRELNAIIDSLINLFSGFGAGTSAFGNVPSLDSTSGVRSPNILDLGDFDEAQLAEAIALAFRLQGSIPGASEAAADDVLNVIKDAQFLQQVRGLDEELLRKAIEELVDVEKARLELEKQRANLLANLQVNTGPLSSLVSQPFSFGTSGAFLGGTGFNSNPQQQGVVVNIGTISGQALTAAQIQKLMYDAISRALADAAKL